MFFPYAFLYVRIRINQIATHWKKVFRKDFFVKRYSPIFQNIALIVHAQKFWTKFLSLCNSLLSADIWTYQNADKKAQTFYGEAKTLKSGQKRAKSVYCCSNLKYFTLSWNKKRLHNNSEIFGLYIENF